MGRGEGGGCDTGTLQAELKKQLEVELAASEVKNQKRSLGNIRFIGELFKLKVRSTPTSSAASVCVCVCYRCCLRPSCMSVSCGC